jgi:hypothetical protein
MHADDQSALDANPRHNQCEIILCLLVIEESVHLSKVSSRISAENLFEFPDSREEAVLVKLLADRILRLDNSIRI